ncbi:phage Mu F virion morphogenesis protein [Burkholderia pseudomallei]|nr:phage Mu F virion morphogenesis protein [Burkholderia pseudomallei]
MALDLTEALYEQALAQLAEQGVDLADIDTGMLLEAEQALANLAARVTAATLAKRALSAFTAGASVDDAIKNAFSAYVQAGYAAANVDNSLRLAYGAGRYQSGAEAETLPFATLSTMRDAKVRPSHAALDGTTLPKDDDFWKTHWPPMGYRCRCRAYFVNQRQVDRLGRSVAESAPQEDTKTYSNASTGEAETVPVSIAPGWLVNGLAPALDPAAALSQALTRSLAELSAMAG